MEKQLEKSKQSLFGKLIEMRELSILLIIVVMGIVLGFASPNFMTLMNLKIILNGFALNMIFGVGMTISLIAGNIDFSVGSTLGVCGFITALLLQSGMAIPLVIVLVLCIGGFLGFVNGFLIVRLKVLPIVVTLGTWMAYQGIGLMIVGNRSLAQLPAAFKAISQQTTVCGVPFNVAVMIVVVLVGMLLLKYVGFFHQAYFIGGNRESARLAGIKVNKFIMISYLITGALCALSAVLMVSRLGSAPGSLGQGIEFKVIVGMLIGGVSFNGGEGSIFGALLGMLLMSMISNALSIFGVNSYAQLIIVGAILIASVSLDEANRRRREGSK